MAYPAKIKSLCIRHEVVVVVQVRFLYIGGQHVRGTLHGCTIQAASDVILGATQEYYLNVLAAPPKQEASKKVNVLDSGAVRALKNLVRGLRNGTTTSEPVPDESGSKQPRCSVPL